MANPRAQSYIERAREAAAKREWTLAEGFERQAAAELARAEDPGLRARLAEITGERAMRQGDYKTAIEATERALAGPVRRGPGELVVLRHRLGLARANAGDHEAAVAAFHTALVDAPAQLAPTVRQALWRSEQALQRERTGGEAPPPPRPAVPDPVVPPPTPPDSFEKVMSDLDALVGLQPVKAEVRRLASLLRVQRQREAQGRKPVVVNHHMAFLGPPGTGKTTVARLFGRIYRLLGILPQADVVEATRADLVAGYVGQTAGRVDEIVNRSLGKVLLIDEAYALAPADGGGQDFGHEALAQLLVRLENDREKFVCILAGYPVEMRAFLDQNPGMTSRLAGEIAFPDYSAAELSQIFLRTARAYDYRLRDPAIARLESLLVELVSMKGPRFGNARAVRNLFEDAVAAQAERVAADGLLPDENLDTIEAADLPTDLAGYAGR
jgi:SpoVK/Ycf46/Vps4 family AAA+-type ATPase